MPVVWRLYQARMWLLNLQGIVVINKHVRFVDGCWYGCGWETWSHMFLFLREEPLGFDDKWFDDKFQIQRKEKKTQSSLSRLQVCPLYMFGNKATDGTYRALIQGQIYKTALFLNFFFFRKTLHTGKYLFSFQEGLERFLHELPVMAKPLPAIKSTYSSLPLKKIFTYIITSLSNFRFFRWNKAFSKRRGHYRLGKLPATDPP